MRKLERDWACLLREISDRRRESDDDEEEIFYMGRIAYRNHYRVIVTVTVEEDEEESRTSLPRRIFLEYPCL
jgi:hypothetical protein